MCSSAFGARAMAEKAPTAFVEPPITLMTAMALRKDRRVTISLRPSVSFKMCHNSVQIRRTSA
jgi:hypothetical protein